MPEQKKVLVKEKLAPEGVKYLEDQGFQVDIGTEWDADELLRRISEYHGLIIRSATKVTAEVIQAGEKLQVVGRAGVGVDNVDVPTATQLGIVVMNTPDGNTLATAELTMALILGLCRKIHLAYASLHGGQWDRKSFQGAQLAGKTLGVVGLGRIGSAVARRALGFDMKVIGFDPYFAGSKELE